MRKLLFFFLIFPLLSLYSQESNIQIGAKAGVSLATFSRNFFYQTQEFSYITDFYVGALAVTRTEHTINGKLELIYSGQGAKYNVSHNPQYEGKYNLGYLSLAYIMHFRLSDHFYLDAGLSTDLLVRKDSKIPSPRTFDIAGIVGIEVPILPSLSLEARAKSGRGGLNNYEEYYTASPFQNSLNNLVVQFGIIYSL